MPRVKIDYIVSFSSEDANNPASNLLEWEVGKKKWLSPKGEPSCSVVLQLTRSVEISAVHIGAHHAALVEVLVGRSETPNEPFQVLVPSCVFLSPRESRAAEGTARVRIFSGDQIGARGQHWDRVRCVISQPYNKHCQYGLSFIHIFEPESASGGSTTSAPVGKPVAPSVPASGESTPAKALPARLLALDALSSDDEEFRPGELFAQHRAGPATPAANSTAAQIKQATSQALRGADAPSPLVKTPIAPRPTPRHAPRASHQPSPRTSPPPRTSDALLYTEEDDRAHQKIDKVVKRHKEDVDKKRAVERAENGHADRKRGRDYSTDRHKAADRSRDRPVESSHDKRDERSRDKRDERSQDKRDKNPQNERDKDSRDKRDEGSREKRDEGSRDKRDKDSRDKRDKDSRDKRDKDSRDKWDGESRNRKHKHADTSSTEEPPLKKQAIDKNAAATSSREGRTDGQASDKISNEPMGKAVALPSILRGETLVLSGYQNPERARHAAAARALGARLERDWGPRCTHLICAFSNTPKLRAVRTQSAHTPAARAEWLHACVAARRRLPWRWFATEPARALPPPSPLPRADSDDADTDDEIERVLRDQKKTRPLSPSPPPPSPRAARSSSAANVSADSDVAFVKDERLQGEVSIRDSDSDSDATEPEPEPEAGPEPLRADAGLPPVLEGLSVALCCPHRRLPRYLAAYGAVLIEDVEAADYTLCTGNCAGRCKRKKSGTLVRAAWLWDCHELRKRLDTGPYLVHPTPNRS